MNSKQGQTWDRGSMRAMLNCGRRLKCSLLELWTNLFSSFITNLLIEVIYFVNKSSPFPRHNFIWTSSFQRTVSSKIVHATWYCRPKKEENIRIEVTASENFMKGHEKVNPEAGDTSWNIKGYGKNSKRLFPEAEDCRDSPVVKYSPGGTICMVMASLMGF